jgi:hypothetical protein
MGIPPSPPPNQLDPASTATTGQAEGANNPIPDASNPVIVPGDTNTIQGATSGTPACGAACADSTQDSQVVSPNQIAGGGTPNQLEQTDQVTDDSCDDPESCNNNDPIDDPGEGDPYISDTGNGSE